MKVDEEDLKIQFGRVKWEIVINGGSLLNYLITVDELVGQHLDEKAKKSENSTYEIKDEDYLLVQFGKGLSNIVTGIEKHFNQTLIRKYFYSSCLVMVYSLFEDSAKKVAEIAKKISNSKLKYSDIKEPNDVIKVKKYLERHLNLDLSSKNELWSDLVKFTKVRNQIVHKVSFVDFSNDSDKKLIKLLEKDKRIDFTNESFVIKDIEYVKDFLLKASEYIEFMCELLEKEYLEK